MNLKKYMILICLFLSVLYVGAADTAKTQTPPQVPLNNPAIPVIIDTDMAQDDWMAILYIMQRPDINVLGITVAGTGEALGPDGQKVAMGLTMMQGCPEIPVTYGPPKPMKGDQQFPLSWRKKEDKALGIPLPVNPVIPPKTPAVDWMINKITDYPNKVTILALGPLTNLGLALEKKPDITENIERIVIMGGAVFVPGNVHASTPSIKNKTAEWNIFVDPFAANIVFGSGAPVTLVPLDACNTVPLNEAFYSRVKKLHTTPAGNFLLAILNSQSGFVHSEGWYFWDPLAAGVLANPDIATRKDLKILANTTPGPNYARTEVSEKGYTITVCVDAGGKRFKDIFLGVMNDSYSAQPIKK